MRLLHCKVTNSRPSGGGAPSRAAAARLMHYALDDLKIELLTGEPGPSTLLRLRSDATGLRDFLGDAALDALLAEIELRVEVEIAKMTPR